ncbi:hypothetical protein M747DRAFT_49750 [Aspergillus niger ATCC 13496]|uniref:Uncharacterized protein n=1 Tax=Aspergillus niger ATCC 13496 TaxID=1353008 RepID=A0A370BWL7_ASPNG|nr:hypothetical protein M747DRAFT_49750 [Aspergillus niger ATCC 13496]
MMFCRLALCKMLDLGLFVSTLAAFGGWFFNSVAWIVQTTRLFYCQQCSPVNVWECSLKTCSLTEQVGTLVPIRT